MEKIKPEMRIFDSSDELSSNLADYVLQVAESAVKERGSFSLVLSGGDIPIRLGYSLSHNLCMQHSLKFAFVSWFVA